MVASTYESLNSNSERFKIFSLNVYAAFHHAKSLNPQQLTEFFGGHPMCRVNYGIVIQLHVQPQLQSEYQFVPNRFRFTKCTLHNKSLQAKTIINHIHPQT